MNVRRRKASGDARDAARLLLPHPPCSHPKHLRDTTRGLPRSPPPPRRGRSTHVAVAERIAPGVPLPPSSTRVQPPRPRRLPVPHPLPFPMRAHRSRLDGEEAAAMPERQTRTSTLLAGAPPNRLACVCGSAPRQSLRNGARRDKVGRTLLLSPGSPPPVLDVGDAGQQELPHPRAARACRRGTRLASAPATVSADALCAQTVSVTEDERGGQPLEVTIPPPFFFDFDFFLNSEPAQLTDCSEDARVAAGIIRRKPPGAGYFLTLNRDPPPKTPPRARSGRGPL